ncbi:class IIb bacteriocin, lactobin A/cerein 7B family [Rhodocaloribacter sp.]
MEAQPKPFEEFIQELLKRSATDWDFRQKLLENPKEAVSEFAGKPVRESFNVAFIENKADATFVLPNLVTAGDELSEEELESVAGGVTPVIISVLGTIASALASYDAWFD